MSAVKLHTVKLSDLGRVVTGKTPPSSRPDLFGTLHPFITPTDIDGISRTVATTRFISDAGAAAFPNQMIPRDSVCFVCIGATIGKMCIASRRSLTNQQVNSIVVDEHRHDPRFVFYALRQIAPDVKALAGGAATPIISKSSFSDITVSVPPLAEQRRIASILSAYDDLIENNTRRIAILEEMARRIYEEWFVHFRFPGHEHVRMVESELGPVPEGWRVAQLSAVAERVGKSMSPSAEPDETFEHFSLPAFDASHRPAVEGGSTIMSNKLELDSDVVLLSKLNPRIKRIWVVSGEANRRRVCSTEFLPYKAKPPFTPWFLFLLFDSDRFQSRYIGGAVGTSTSHQRVKPADVDRIDVVVPDLHVIGKFDRIVIPMLQLVDMLRLANTNLRTTRDLLLPKLISGELDVSTLPEPEAVAA